MNSPANVTLRPCTPDDQDFLFQLYSSTRIHELAPLGWNPAQQEMFLRMQWAAQQRWYEMAYAAASHQIICLEGRPIGRIMVLREPAKFQLVDISLLTEHRGHGIGAWLLSDLIAESEQAGVPVGLQVLKNNPAIHLYERSGFVRTGADEMYYQMERKSGD
ncbi:MAG: GNAT family N-acetyltransferase [Acidobacteriia bacterium]|nr:GNAT family N-acetyltransferase [Terriglobia bacterium]